MMKVSYLKVMGNSKVAVLIYYLKNAKIHTTDPFLSGGVCACVWEGGG